MQYTAETWARTAGMMFMANRWGLIRHKADHLSWKVCAVLYSRMWTTERELESRTLAALKMLLSKG